jgi:hypothetical protein
VFQNQVFSERSVPRGRGHGAGAFPLALSGDSFPLVRIKAVRVKPPASVIQLPSASSAAVVIQASSPVLTGRPPCTRLRDRFPAALCQKRATVVHFPHFWHFMPYVESVTYVFSKAANGSTPSVRTTGHDPLSPRPRPGRPGLALFSFTPGACGCILMSGWALVSWFFVVLSGCSVLRID